VDGTEGTSQIFAYPPPPFNFAGFVLAGTMTAVRGADLTTPIVAVAELVESGTSRTAPSVTTTTINNLVLVMMQAAIEATTPVDIPGMIRLLLEQGFGTGGSDLACTIGLWSELFPAAGATGTFTSPSGWGEFRSMGLTVAIKPGFVIPPPPPPPVTANDKIISIGIMTSLDGLTDDLWAIVERGDGNFTVEKFDATVNTDSASQNDLGAKFSSVSGLGYLAGKTVDVLGDGAYYGLMVVPGSGILPLNPPARVVEVGLHYDSSITSLFIEQKGGPNNQGYRKRFNKLWVRIKNTLNLIVDGMRVSFRVPSDNMSQGVPINVLVNDVEKKNLGYSRSLQWRIVQDQPFPAEILAVFGDLEIGEN